MENTNVYMATIATQTDDQERPITEEIVIVAKNITEAESFIEDNQKIQRIVVMENWILADKREEYTGDYYMVDTIYESAVTYKDDDIIYLVQAENFSSIEEITKEEAGETFKFIKSSEIIPYRVFH